MDRAKTIETIRNLRAKAGDAASSEAEAAAAAMMLTKLMMKHDVTETELEVKEQSAAHDGYKNSKMMPVVLNYCWGGIQALTETKCYKSNGSLNFIGMEHDVEMALYLTEMIVGAAKRAWAHTGYEGPLNEMRVKRLSFMIGFGDHLNTRMLELYRDRQAAREAMASSGAATGTAIVIVKKDAIRAKMQEMGLTLRKGGTNKRFYIDGGSYSRGRDAGANVNLNRSVGDNVVTGKRIGK